MTAAPDLSPRPADGADPRARELLRSTGLGQFRKSPFRMLRLRPTATAKQAVWQCNKALARARVGTSLPDPDPLPWLPPGDEIEIQEAAQTMESPLARIIEQLLWFGATGEADAAPGSPDGGVIDLLIACDGAALRAYLEGPATSIAHRINQANLGLLLGFSQLQGVGPTLSAPGSAAAVAALAWKTTGGLSIVADPHKALCSSDDATWAQLLGRGVTTWGELLTSIELADHVRAAIAALGDELLTADDLEAVISGLRTRIADLIVGETKLEIAQGRLDRVSRLSAIAGQSKIDAETWLIAFRPLKTQFQLELADLVPEAETGLGLIEDVKAYLDRLTTVAERWRPIDRAQLLGLSGLIDDAVEEAFGRLRGAPRAIQLGAPFSDALTRIGDIARSPSFKERIKGYRERLVDVSKSMCHFCGIREREIEHCASVSSRMETHREHYGNGYRIHYRVGAMPLARCQRCAILHGFIRSIGPIAFFSLAASIILLALVHPPSWFTTIETGPGVLLTGIAITMAIGVAWLARGIAAMRVTPKGEHKFNDYMVSYAVEQLRSDGFYSFNYDSRPDAWTLVTRQGVAHRHGGGKLGASLKVLFYIALAAGYIILRVFA
jgi:hypothetical protein